MGRRLGKFDLGILGIQNLIPIAAFHGIFEYSSNNIRIFEPKIFEYSYSVHLMLTNIFVFGPEVDPEYIRSRNRVKKNIPNIFVFVFGPQKNIRYALVRLGEGPPHPPTFGTSGLVVSASFPVMFLFKLPPTS